MMSSRRIRTTLLLAAGLALGACASTSTSIVDSRKAPGAGPLRFNKVLALAVLDNEGLRERAEDALRANLRNVHAVQGYKIFRLAELSENREQVEERLRQDGFDGVVALSPASSHQELGWTAHHDPLAEFVWYPTEQLAVDTIHQVEIKVYSLTEKKLLWAGISKTFNSKAAEDLIAKVAAAAGQELRRQGLL